MAAIRNGILALVICVVPATSADAGCGLFSPCGSPSWIGFNFALPVPRFAHLHTFVQHSNQSPYCGAGQCGWGLGRGGCGSGLGYGLGGCCAPSGPVLPPPVLTPPMGLAPPPLMAPSACNPCAVPMVQTEMVPQQTVSYREVPQIQYRQEAYTASVPVTTYQQVTRYRSVPYQTVSRVPQVSTQYVPRQRISHFTPSAPCDPCLAGSAIAPYGMAPAALPYTSAPPAAGVPEYPLAGPQADADSQWQNIPQRQAQQNGAIEQMSGYSNSYRRPGRGSAFQPAPSAATAWQSRWLR